MSIIYTLIANKPSSVICEYTDKSGNFAQVSRVILNKEVEADTQKALEANRYKFHYINENKITFMCLSEGRDDKSIISYLKEIRDCLYKTYDYEVVLNAHAFQMKAFSKSIQEIKEYYDNMPRQSISGEIISDLKEAQTLMKKNISDLIDRGIKLEVTEQKAKDLASDAVYVSGYVS